MLRQFIAILTLVFLPMAAMAQDDFYFEVESLNQGLSGTADELDLLTPQTAMASFLDAVEAEDFDAAAHALNLNDLPVALQQSRGAELAEKLAIVIDRKVVISWQALLERPDSLDANAPSDDAMAGQARRSLLLGILEHDNRTVAIRLNRVKPSDANAVWVFSRQTVNLIEPLFEAYGPSKFEKMLPDWARTKGPMGLFWWELIGMPILLLLMTAIGLGVWKAFTAAHRKIGRTNLANAVKGLRLPLTLAAIAATMWFSTNYIFVVSGLISNILEPIIVILFVASGMIFLINIIDAVLSHIMLTDVEELASPEEEDRRAFATTIFALRRFLVVVAVLLGAGITLTTANVFQTLGFSLLASAGALTLMLGFAAREVLGNILASLQISLNRSARVGDQLIFEDALCTVERIHFSFVQLKVWDGTRLVVPVSEFISESFVNRTLVDNEMTRVVKLTVAPQIDVDALRNYYMEWVKNDDRVSPEEKYECLVVGQDEYGIQIRFCAPITDPRDGWDVECELREALIRKVNEMGEDLLPHIGTTDDPKTESRGYEDEAA